MYTTIFQHTTDVHYTTNFHYTTTFLNLLQSTERYSAPLPRAPDAVVDALVCVGQNLSQRMCVLLCCSFFLSCFIGYPIPSHYSSPRQCASKKESRTQFNNVATSSDDSVEGRSIILPFYRLTSWRISK